MKNVVQKDYTIFKYPNNIFIVVLLIRTKIITKNIKTHQNKIKTLRSKKSKELSIHGIIPYSDRLEKKEHF